jgi:hypothetical protein
MTTARIRALNDDLRRHSSGGLAVMTPGVAALGTDFVQRAISAGSLRRLPQWQRSL